MTAKANIDLGPIHIELVEEDVTTLLASVKTVSENTGDLLEDLVTVKQLAIAKGLFQEKPVAAANPPSAKSSGGSSAPASNDAPTCKHGPMADYSDRGYAKKWYCTKRGKDKECWARN